MVERTRQRPRGLACASCGRDALGSGYRVTDSAGPALKCSRCALLHPPLIVNGLKTALIVGTVLTAINQGDTLLRGAVSLAVMAKIALTYVVPYIVSTSGALAATRVRGSGVEDQA